MQEVSLAHSERTIHKPILPPPHPDICRLIEVERHEDTRGTLLVPNPAVVPFPIRRTFMITDVPAGAIRGEHAHMKSKELLWCLRGKVRVMLDTGRSRHEFLLDRPTQALYIPARTWISMGDFASETTLLAFSSEAYDPEDYIRDYIAFRNKLG